jgi:hypothetical protein
MREAERAAQGVGRGVADAGERQQHAPVVAPGREMHELPQRDAGDPATLVLGVDAPARLVRRAILVLDLPESDAAGRLAVDVDAVHPAAALVPQPQVAGMPLAHLLSGLGTAEVRRHAGLVAALEHGQVGLAPLLQRHTHVATAFGTHPGPGVRRSARVRPDAQHPRLSKRG